MTKALRLFTFVALALFQVTHADRGLAVEAPRECTAEPPTKCIVYVSDTPSPPPTDGSCPQLSSSPTKVPSAKPSATPSSKPSAKPSATPIAMPSAKPSATPSAEPTAQGERSPSETPSSQPSKADPQCVAMVDDKFDNGNDGWIPSNSHAQHISGNTTQFSALWNYMRLKCPSSSSSISKTFNQPMPGDSTLFIDFDFCWLNTETSDKLELNVKVGTADFVTIGTWKRNGNNGNHGCENGAKHIDIPKNTGEVQIEFKATGSHTGEYFYIDNVRTEWCDTGACPLKVLNFNTLKPNTYVHDLQSEYGVTVTVNGGWQGNGGDAMVFDTTRPVGHFGCDASNSGHGDPDLGAPNKKCPGGGPGKGKWKNGIMTGSPQSSHPNCEHVGNVLIIQEHNLSPNCPDDTGNGGTIVFDFDHADGVTMEFAGLLDTDEGETPKITGTDVNGNDYTTLQVEETGDNGYTKEAYSYSNVKKLTILYDGSGSIAELGYRVCPV